MSDPSAIVATAAGPRIAPVALEGRVVRLEPLARTHLEGLIEAARDPAIWTWMFEPLTTPERVAAWLEAALANEAGGTELPFATIERATGRVVGSSRYMAIALEHRRLEIGWTWLAPARQGTAANTDAKLLQLEHAFERVGCRRVEFKTDARNERSRAALLGIGARFEGVFRKHMIMADGRQRDSAYYSIVDDEWPAVRDALRSRLAERLAATG
jgi:RimJ/RimL family protein N-acetyltransferase